MLSMLIPGEKAPGNDIDVYLEPLIDELKELWDNGVETNDASIKKNFKCEQLYCGRLAIFLVMRYCRGGV